MLIKNITFIIVATQLLAINSGVEMWEQKVINEGHISSSNGSSVWTDFHEILLILVLVPFSPKARIAVSAAKKSGSYTARLHTSDD